MAHLMRTALACMFVLSLLAGCAPAATAPGPAAPAGPGSDDPAWLQVVEAAKKEGKLLIYGRLLDGVEGTKYADEFGKRYGITVDFINGAGSAMFERIRNETKSGQASADLYSGAPPWPDTFRQEKMFVPLKDKPFPLYKEPKETWRIEPWYMVEDRTYLANEFGFLPGHISINPKLVQPADYPKSYQQLITDPKYKGKLAWVNPKLTGEIAARWVTNGYVGGFWSLRDLWTLYAQQQPLLFANPTDSVAAVGRGEAAISVFAGGQNAISAVEAGTLKVLRFPDIPLVYFPNAMGVLTTAKNPNAAMVFINWFYSKEGHELYTSLNKTNSIRKDVASKQPDAVKAEVPGGGKIGPDFVLNGIQVQLQNDLNTAKVMNGLPEGISYDDFERGYNNFIKEWESKMGGPQKHQLPMVQ